MTSPGDTPSPNQPGGQPGNPSSGFEYPSLENYPPGAGQTPPPAGYPPYPGAVPPPYPTAQGQYPPPPPYPGAAGQAPYPTPGQPGVYPPPYPPGTNPAGTGYPGYPPNTPPGYSDPYGYGAAAASGTNGMATGSLIASLIGIFCCIGAIPGLIMGIMALNQLKASPQQQGKGMAIAGIVISSITMVLYLLYVVFVFVIMAGNGADTTTY